jgi:hypothetical protein
MSFPTWEEIRANRSALYVGRKPTISKHRATNTVHLRALLDRLDAAGDAEAADTIAWLLWWEAINANRERFLIDQHYEALADKIGEAMEAPCSPGATS